MPGLTPFEKLRRAGVTPERSLGQNFLVDANILDVIEAAAGLDEADVVLEVGPGLGVLTERLLARCRCLHAVEIDPALAALLEEEYGRHPRLVLHRADAVRLDLGALEPPPNKFVSNLPYSVAAPLVARSLAALPRLERWCLMLQEEVADRLFAPTGSRDYTGLSVLVQLQAAPVSRRRISANVFYPKPRVRSVLLVFDRKRFLAPERRQRLEQLVRAAFGQRRKMLVNSLAGAASPPEPLASLEPARRRQVVAAALGRMGLSRSVRPQELAPDAYLQLSEELRSVAGGDSDA